MIRATVLTTLLLASTTALADPACVPLSGDHALVHARSGEWHLNVRKATKAVDLTDQRGALGTRWKATPNRGGMLVIESPHADGYLPCGPGPLSNRPVGYCAVPDEAKRGHFDLRCTDASGNQRYLNAKLKGGQRNVSWEAQRTHLGTSWILERWPDAPAPATPDGDPSVGVAQTLGASWTDHQKTLQVYWLGGPTPDGVAVTVRNAATGASIQPTSQHFDGQRVLLQLDQPLGTKVVAEARFTRSSDGAVGPAMTTLVELTKLEEPAQPVIRLVDGKLVVSFPHVPSATHYGMHLRRNGKPLGTQVAMNMDLQRPKRAVLTVAADSFRSGDVFTASFYAGNDDAIGARGPSGEFRFAPPVHQAPAVTQESAPPPAVHQGPTPLDAAAFASVVKNVQAERSSHRQKEVVEAYVGHSHFTLRQVAQLVELFAFDHHRMDVARLCRPRTVGRPTMADLYELVEAFDGSSDRVDAVELYNDLVVDPMRFGDLSPLFSFSHHRAEVRDLFL